MWRCYQEARYQECQTYCVDQNRLCHKVNCLEKKKNDMVSFFVNIIMNLNLCLMSEHVGFLSLNFVDIQHFCYILEDSKIKCR